MLRWLAAEGESYRGLRARLGHGQYGVQNRGAMLHQRAVVGNTAGVPPARLPAGRYSSSRGWWYFKPPPAAQCAIVPPENGL